MEEGHGRSFLRAVMYKYNSWAMELDWQPR